VPLRPRAWRRRRHAHPFMEKLSGALAPRASRRSGTSSPTWSRGNVASIGRRFSIESIREAVAVGARERLPLFAGGKSMGGRMTSQAQSLAPLAGVLAFPSSDFPCIRRASPRRAGGTPGERSSPDALSARDARRPRRSALLRPVIDGWPVRRSTSSTTRTIRSMCARAAAAR